MEKVLKSLNDESSTGPTSPSHVTALVVGGGFGGIGAGVYLKKAGIEDFRIIEEAAGLGGTWWYNNYPGAEVDVHSHLYSFPFKRFDWTRTHAQQPEMQRYIKEIVDDYDLSPHISLMTRVIEAVWDEEAKRYRVFLSTEEVVTTQVLISAVGLMNVPKYPCWQGLDDFAGPKFHTARWEHEHDLTGKRVAVVGTGSSSSQVVAALAPKVKNLYVFQREPGWVLPKGDYDFSPNQRAAYARETELKRRWTRERHYLALMRRQWFASLHRPNGKENKRCYALALSYLDETFGDRPDLKVALTPNYPFSGKRTVINSQYYPALRRPNVHLIPHEVVAVTRTGIVDASGAETFVDVLVLATGFQQANVLSSLRVVGRGGRDLHDTWAQEPRALMGITVPDFPNFFMLYGPNTNGGEIFGNHRAQAMWAIRSIKRLRRTNGTIETRRGPFELFDKWLQWTMRNTSWVQANNYFKSSTGRIVTQWPYDAFTYRVLARLAYRVGVKHQRYRAG